MNTENEFRDIIKQFDNLKSIKASDSYKKRVRLLIDSLPKNKRTFSIFVTRFALACVLLVITGGGMVAAAEKSNPGEFLYPVKRVTEQVKLALSGNPTMKALLHLENADKRVLEIEKAATSNNEELVPTLAIEYETELEGAKSELEKDTNQKDDVEATVQQKVSEQKESLLRIQVGVPSQTQQSVQNAIDASDNFIPTNVPPTQQVQPSVTPAIFQTTPTPVSNQFIDLSVSNTNIGVSTNGTVGVHIGL